MSAVHPSLAMHIPLFCLLQGYQKHEKTKTIENPCQIPEYCKNLENQKTKKNKKGEPMYIQNLEKPKKTKKKQNGRTYVPVSGMGQYFCFFCFFLVFRGKTKKTKKTKWQNLCPSVWHGVSTFVFFCFFGFSRFLQYSGI